MNQQSRKIIWMLALPAERGEENLSIRETGGVCGLLKNPTDCKPCNDNAVFSVLMMTTVMLLNYLLLRLNPHINIRNVQVFLLTKSFFFPLTDQGYSCKYTFHCGLYLVGEI